MKFFIDSADIKEIRQASELGVLDGVTTNPSLMAKAGIKGNEAVVKNYKKICDIVKGDVSAEVISTDFKGMVDEAMKLASIDDHIVVKIPMIKDGVKAIKFLKSKGIRTNCTLVFSAGQAMLAAKAGAAYVSPFIGRIDDSGWDGLQLIQQLSAIFHNYGFETMILAASIRSSLHIVRCAEVGAHVATAPLSAILGLLNHPLTDIGLKKFLEDYKKVSS